MFSILTKKEVTELLDKNEVGAVLDAILFHQALADIGGRHFVVNNDHF